MQFFLYNYSSSQVLYRPIQSIEFIMTSGVFLLACICPSLTVSSVVDVVPPNLESFDKFVGELMDCRRVPGLVVTVVDMRSQPTDNGEHATKPLVVQRQYGWADVDARRPMLADTRLCVASLTKAFTSTLLGIMLNNITRQVTYLRRVDI